jgi:hypothetical protein
MIMAIKDFYIDLRSGDITIERDTGPETFALADAVTVQRDVSGNIVGIKTPSGEALSTGSGGVTPVASQSTSGLMSSTDKVKLDGVQSGATSNSADSSLLNRSNHTGTQAISTIVGLQGALDNKASVIQGDKADTALQPADMATVNGQSLTNGGNIAVSGGSSFILPSRTANGAEDTVITGTLLAGLTGASIVQFTLGSTVYTPSATARSIVGYGDITIQADGTFTFDSLTNWHGVTPSIPFQAASADGEIRQSALTITVTPVDDAPTAYADYAVTALNQSVTIYPLTNDIDPDGTPVTSITTINGVTPVQGVAIQCTNCTAMPIAGNGVTITPDGGYSGRLSVPYTIAGAAAPSAITVDVAPSEMPMFSPASAADPALFPWFYTMANWYGPAGSATNPTSLDNGLLATSATYTAGWGAWEGDADLDVVRAGYLFDNPTTLFNIFRSTGDSRYLGIAADRCEQFYSHVVIDSATGYGYLNINPLSETGTGGKTALELMGDTKYNYCAPYVWYEQFVGPDSTMRAKALACAKSQLQNPKTYSTEMNFWTERQIYFAIRETLAAYWLTADVTWLNHAQDYANVIYSMCAATGAPIHLESQHEGGDAIDMASTWMAPMLAESMLQLYRTNGDARFLPWIVAYCDWMQANGFYQGVQAPGLVPWYYWTENGGFTDIGEDDDVNHAYDVAHMMRMGKWARQQLGLTSTTYDATINSLQQTAAYCFADLIRQGGPSDYYAKYRISPTRKGNWWFVNSQSMSFALNVPLPAPVPMPAMTSAPTISGASTQGTAVTINPGVWTPTSGGNAPTFAYTMQRSADSGATWADIAGSGGSGSSHTYTYQAADVGKQVRVKVTATNSKGSSIEYSTAGTILAAGAPSFTQHPSTQSVAATGTATFTVSITGSGLTVDFQKSTDSGATWVSVQSSASMSWTTPTLTQGDTGMLVRVVATNGAGTATSNVATLTVTAAVRRVGVTSGGADNGSGCAAYYSSIVACELSERQNLVTNGRILQIEVDAFADVGTVTFAAANWTADATRYINIVARAGQGHGGAIGAGYRLTQTAGTWWNMVIGVPYTVLDGIGVVQTTAAAEGAIRFLGTAANSVVRNPVIVGATNADSAIHCDPQVTVENPILIGFKYGVRNENFATKVFVRNGTAVGQSISSYYGGGGTESTLVNCYGQAASAAFSVPANANNPMTNCASADSTASGGVTGVPYSTSTFTNVTGGVENLNLVVGSALLGAGASSGGTSSNIAGAVRSNPPNIGAF